MKREAGRVWRPSYSRMITPEFKEFSRLARAATLVPVVKSVSADLLTPVSAFLAIAEKEPHAFLLESVPETTDSSRKASWALFLRLREMRKPE